jgi:hypothetical protein
VGYTILRRGGPSDRFSVRCRRRPRDARRCGRSAKSHGASISDQPSGRAAKSRLAFLYHPIPDMGCFHLPFISFKALWCVSSRPATISLKCLSCALMTSSAVSPWSARSHGPPNCLHVIAFMNLVSFHGVGRQLRRVETDERPQLRYLTAPSAQSTASRTVRPARCGPGCPRGRGTHSRALPRVETPAPGAPRRPTPEPSRRWHRDRRSGRSQPAKTPA